MTCILFIELKSSLIKPIDISCCMFVCPELIEELAEATYLKLGMHVEHVVSRKKSKDLSDISTNF